MPLNLIKLCVGCDTVEELLDWRNANAVEGEPWILRTRQTPKRAGELVEGGSVYRVYKGMILSRQLILAVNTVGAEGQKRCEVTLSPDVILVVPTPRRAFQGWRYLEGKDAPPDLGPHLSLDLPPELARQLREAGAW